MVWGGGAQAPRSVGPYPDSARRGLWSRLEADSEPPPSPDSGTRRAHLGRAVCVRGAGCRLGGPPVHGGRCWRAEVLSWPPDVAPCGRQSIAGRWCAVPPSRPPPRHGAAARFATRAGLVGPPRRRTIKVRAVVGAAPFARPTAAGHLRTERDEMDRRPAIVLPISPPCVHPPTLRRFQSPSTHTGQSPHERKEARWMVNCYDIQW